MADPNKNRFYFNNEFRLYDIDGIFYSAGTYFAFLDDPVGFDGVQVRMVRGEEHGVNYEFSDGEINLEFDSGNGKEFIEAIFAENGPDSRIDFEIYDLDNSESLFRGRLKLSDAEFTSIAVICPVERANFEHLFRTRYETKVNLFDAISLDGQIVGPLEQQNIQVYGKAQAQKFDAEKPADQFAAAQATEQEDNVYFTPSFPIVNLDEFSGDINPPGLQFWNNTPVESKAYFYKAVEGGLFEIEVETSSRLFVQTRFFSSFDTLVFALYMEIVSENGDSKKIRIGDEVRKKKISNKANTDTDNQSFAGTNKIILNKNDELYLYYQVDLTDDFQKNYEFDLWESGLNRLRVTGLTAAEATNSKAVLLFDALRQALRLTTNVGEPFFSDFFGFPDRGYSRTGEGANNIITLGRILRNFDFPPLTASFRSLYESLDAIFCLGMDITGNQLRIEAREYFYRQTVTKSFTHVGNYREKVAKELLWNELKFGFKKYLTEEINTLDSVHQEIEYLTPLRATKQKLEKLSDIICDSYAIEETRRQQFEEEINDNWRYDDDLFLIAVSRPYTRIFNIIDEPSLIGSFRTNFPTDETDTELLLTLRTLGNLTARFYNRQGQEYKYSYPVDDVRLNDEGKILIDVNVTVGFNFRLIPTDYQYQVKVQAEDGIATERDDPFEYVDGVFSASTFTNLRHSIGNIVRRWSLWINSALSYKESSELIRTTFVKGNQNAVTKFAAAEQFVRGNPDRLPIREGQNISLIEFNRFSKLFTPIYIEFETDLSWKEIDEIRQNSYGLFQVTGHDGIQKSGWLQELTYNPVTEKCEVKLLMKNSENFCQLLIAVSENELEFIVNTSGNVGAVEYQAEQQDGTVIQSWQDSNRFQKTIFPAGIQIIKAREKDLNSCEVSSQVIVPDFGCYLTMSVANTSATLYEVTVNKNGELLTDPDLYIGVTRNGQSYTAAVSNPQVFNLADIGNYVIKAFERTNSACFVQAQVTVGTEGLLSVSNFTKQNNKQILDSDPGPVYSEEIVINNPSGIAKTFSFVPAASVNEGVGYFYSIETGSASGDYSGTSFDTNGVNYTGISIAAGQTLYARIRYINATGNTLYVETRIREGSGNIDFIVDGEIVQAASMTQELNVQAVVQEPLIQIIDWQKWNNRVFEKSEESIKYHGITKIVNDSDADKLLEVSALTTGITTRFQFGNSDTVFDDDLLYTGGNLYVIIPGNTTRYLRVSYDNQTGISRNVTINIASTDGRNMNVDGTLTKKATIKQTLNVVEIEPCLLSMTASGGDLIINASHSYSDGTARITEYCIQFENGNVLQDWTVYERLINYRVTQTGNYIVKARQQSNPDCVQQKTVSVTQISIDIRNHASLNNSVLTYGESTKQFSVRNNSRGKQVVAIGRITPSTTNADDLYLSIRTKSGSLIRRLLLDTQEGVITDRFAVPIEIPGGTEYLFSYDMKRVDGNTGQIFAFLKIYNLTQTKFIYDGVTMTEPQTVSVNWKS